MSGTHYVYRCYSWDGELLYIGCSGNIPQRMAAHRSGSRAWFWRMHHYVLSAPMPKEDAFRAEAEAIAAEQPTYNQIHTGRHQSHRTDSYWVLDPKEFRSLWVRSMKDDDELARTLGVSIDYLRRAARGQVQPSDARTRLIAEFFDVPVKYIARKVTPVPTRVPEQAVVRAAA